MILLMITWNFHDSIDFIFTSRTIAGCKNLKKYIYIPVNEYSSYCNGSAGVALEYWVLPKHSGKNTRVADLTNS